MTFQMLEQSYLQNISSQISRGLTSNRTELDLQRDPAGGHRLHFSGKWAQRDVRTSTRPRQALSELGFAHALSMRKEVQGEGG